MSPCRRKFPTDIGSRLTMHKNNSQRESPSHLWEGRSLSSGEGLGSAVNLFYLHDMGRMSGLRRSGFGSFLKWAPTANSPSGQRD
jgi:hypothetical protein